MGRPSVCADRNAVLPHRRWLERYGSFRDVVPTALPELMRGGRVSLGWLADAVLPLSQWKKACTLANTVSPWSPTSQALLADGIDRRNVCRHPT